tara:strand:+ start:799 stop:1764 length:966 start_codon:yes stop_codon:yes gene_type:complete
MKVGVVSINNSPYIIRNGDSYSGISIDIWETIAKKANIEFSYVEVSDEETAIQKIKSKELDILVGPYTITSKRYQDIDYTIPYYYSDISLASSKKTKNLENYLKLFKIFGSIIFLFMLILFLNKFIVNFNTKANFADYFINSIPDFKDRKLYILYAIIFICIVIIYIYTFEPDISLNINKKDSLKGKNLAYTINKDMIEKIIKKNEAMGTLIKVKKVSDPVKQVQNNQLFDYYISNIDKVYGFLDDSSKIAYVMNNNITKYENIDIVQNKLAYYLYAFVVPKKSEHLDIINEKLREAQTEKINQIIVTKYLGPKFENSVSF